MTTTTRAVGAVAADRKTGLTLTELTQLVQDCHRADLAGDAAVRVRIGWSGQIQRIDVAGGVS